MEIGRGSEHLMAELNRMREQVVEFSTHLGQPSLSEFCRHWAQNLLSSLEKSISMAKTTSPVDQPNPNVGADSTPRSDSPSPRSENSDSEFKDMSKKRKTMSKHTKQMRVNTGAAGGMDDRYSWRKYGQKVILGAKHPRSYFRCTHRHTQSCKATKQVQRSDEDPLLFDITYTGTHTCLHATQPATARNGQAQANQQQQLLESFRAGLKVKTEGILFGDLGAQDEGPVVPFSFEAEHFGNGAAAMLDNAFFSPSTPDNCFNGAPCASFFSPTTSESTCFQVSPFRASSLEGHYKLSSSEVDVISAAESKSTNPEVDLSFCPLEMLELSTDFGIFDDSSFFPWSSECCNEARH